MGVQSMPEMHAQGCKATNLDYTTRTIDRTPSPSNTTIQVSLHPNGDPSADSAPHVSPLFAPGAWLLPLAPPATAFLVTSLTNAVS